LVWKEGMIKLSNKRCGLTKTSFLALFPRFSVREKNISSRKTAVCRL
jgi:hypothetical protein